LPGCFRIAFGVIHTITRSSQILSYLGRVKIEFLSAVSETLRFIKSVTLLLFDIQN
jgi:hypothetical protein